MSMLVAALVFVPLLAISLAHFVWAAGGTWPIRDEPLLARTVIGRPEVQRMQPRSVSLLVALGTLAAGIVALALADESGGGVWLDAMGLLAAGAFLYRGVIGYRSRWQAERPQEPFATHNRRVYSPLSLAVGVGFLLLVLMRLF